MSQAEKLPKTISILDQGVQDHLHLGAQLYVSHNGEVMADAAIGEARPGVPMRPDSILLWLSAVKPVTAVAIAQLLEQQRLALDDSVTRFIPEFAHGGKDAITVRHLLTHTGGFRAADKIPDHLGWDATLQRIYQMPLEPGWVPGAKAGYHLWSSWFVLGEIVQRIDGRPLSQYLREEIFRPAGMTDSWLGLPAHEYDRYGERVAFMYLLKDGALVPHPLWNKPESAAQPQPGRNGRGPIHDLGKFYEALLAGKLLKPETVRLFTSRQRIGIFDQTFQFALDWGLGFMPNNNRYGVEKVPYGYGTHSSDGAFGHGGAQSSSAFADPAKGLVVAWACNGMPGERLHQQRVRAINTAIYEELGLA